VDIYLYIYIIFSVGGESNGKRISIFNAVNTENGKKGARTKKNWLKNKYTYNDFGRVRGCRRRDTNIRLRFVTATSDSGVYLHTKVVISLSLFVCVCFCVSPSLSHRLCVHEWYSCGGSRKWDSMVYSRALYRSYIYMHYIYIHIWVH